MEEKNTPSIVYCSTHRDTILVKKPFLDLYYCEDCGKYYSMNSLGTMEEYVSAKKSEKKETAEQPAQTAVRSRPVNIDKRLSFSGKKGRNMVLLSRKKIDIGRRAYFRVLCLDLLTGELVNVVDSNGIDQSMHSISEPFISMEELTVFVADFVNVKESDTLYTLRIVSAPSIVGKTEINRLAQKYMLTMKLPSIMRRLGIIVPFHPRREQLFLGKDINYVRLLASSQAYKYSFFLIRISWSQIKRYEKTEKLQIKDGEVFINLNESYAALEGKEVTGMAIIKVVKDSDGKDGFFIEKGYFDSDPKELAKIKKRREQRKIQKTQIEKEKGELERQRKEVEKKIEALGEEPEVDEEAIADEIREGSIFANSDFYGDFWEEYSEEYPEFQEGSHWEEENFEYDDACDFASILEERYVEQSNRLFDEINYLDDELDYLDEATDDNTVSIYQVSSLDIPSFATNFARKRVSFDVLRNAVFGMDNDDKCAKLYIDELFAQEKYLEELFLSKDGE